MSTTILIRVQLVDSASTDSTPEKRALSPEAAQILLDGAERMRAAMREDEERLPSGRGPLSFLGFHPRAS
jgi:hypothetical protein